MRKMILLVLALALLLTACGSAKKETTETSTTSEKEETSAAVSVEEDQETGPVAGETIAVISVKDFGDIKVKFFATSAPKAVENFTTHAKNGYYDGATFHRVMNDFMIQGGDPTGTGGGGESIWGGSFEDEFTELVPIRGALCMANGGPDTNGSQFFIVQTSESYEPYLDQFGLNDAQKELFKEYGGTPWLYHAHTVFGQVFEGMDVVDAIAAVRTGANDKPVTDVVIDHIEVTTAE